MEWWHEQIFLPQWLPRWPEYLTHRPEDFGRLWLVGVDAMPAGTSIGFQDGLGASLGDAVTFGGRVEWSGFLPAEAGAGDLGLVYSHAGRRVKRGDDRKSKVHGDADERGRRLLELDQALLFRDVRVRPRGGLVHVSLARLDRGPALLCTTQEGVRTYDLSRFGYPRLSRWMGRTGLRGARMFRGRLLLWGEHGISYGRPERDPCNPCEAAEPVASVEVGRVGSMHSAGVAWRSSGTTSLAPTLSKWTTRAHCS